MVKVAEHKIESSDLFVRLNALGPEIQRIAAELHRLHTQTEEAFHRSLKSLAVEAEENLKKTVREREEATRKQVLTELRTKYLTELETALTEKNLLEQRHESVVRRLENENQELTAKLSDADQAVDGLRAGLHQIKTRREEDARALEDLAARFSASEETVVRLQREL